MADVPSSAVFLSYASQDAAAVLRIAEALRAAGVEVWFDKDELVGGDAWDAKIRGQIAACALFVPVISAATQARHEGYFRLEWKLAAQRTHMMSGAKAFLLPVVIDETRDAEAHVPAEFRAVQWTRLPGGEGAAVEKFCARVKTLWGGSAMEPGRPRPGKRDEGVASSAEQMTPKEGRRVPAAAWGIAVAVVACGVGGYAWLKRSAEPAPNSAQNAGAGTRPPTAEKPAPAINDKSLVVLPLENLSPDPENAFFTDGMHIEIISTLARIADLTVLSRDAAVELKASPEPLAAKTQKVGVANVITGSVRRAGSDVRVVLELRRARDHALLWTKTYNRQLGEGVFAIQSDIADEVARVLQARERKGTFAGAQHMTKNARAYDLFLKAREKYVRDTSRASIQEIIASLEEALTLDPEFVPAARFFVSVLFYRYRDQRITAEEREQVKRDAKRWAETAGRLAAGGAGDDALAAYYVIFENDPARALSYAQNAVRALPNDSAAHERLGLVSASLARLSESEAFYRRAVALDPFNPGHRRSQLFLLCRLRRAAEFETADADYRRVSGDRVASEGDRDNRYQLYGRLPDSSQNLPLSFQRIKWLMHSRRWPEALAEIEGQLATNRNMLVDERHRRLIQRCDVLRHLQREPEAWQSAQDAKIWLAETSAHPELDASQQDFRLAVTLSRLGEADAALAAFQRFVHARSSDVTPAERISRERQLAEFYAYLNRPRECVELLAKLLSVPSGLTVPMLKVDPVWDNVREDAAFKALLADPKNSAPL
jgi:TolB-like protein